MKLLAAAVLLIALLIGGAFIIGRSPDQSGRAASAADEESLPRTFTREVRGWPHTAQNPAGRYSRDRRACAGRSCVLGFMHNGYASGDVRIFVQPTSAALIPNEGETAVTVAGHDGLHRRIDARTEEWIVRIQGTTIAIRLEARPGASDADLAEANAVIDSMRTEPQDTKLGFRLVFTLKTSDWDSG